MNVKAASEEAYQCPSFDEYVLVVEGKVELHHPGGVTTVDAGSGALLPKNLRVKWRWPGPCRYIPICLPAFSPDNCGREDEPGVPLAKSSESMDALRQLHYKSQFPFVHHVALKERWEIAKAAGETYYPPTFSQDGNFTHATSDPSKLIQVLNHFYKDQPGEWVCLRMTIDSLEAAGVKTIFEGTAPVGDVPAIDMGNQLFPHILGGIPPSAVLSTLPVSRDARGTFLSIPGLFDAQNPSSIARPVVDFGVNKVKFGTAFLGGFCLGALLVKSMTARR